MSFVMDLIMKEGIKHLPLAVSKIEESLGEDEAILIVPAKGRLVLCIGKFVPRVDKVDEENGIYTISTAEATPCRRFLIPDELDKLISSFSNG